MFMVVTFCCKFGWNSIVVLFWGWFLTVEGSDSYQSDFSRELARIFFSGEKNYAFKYK